MRKILSMWITMVMIMSFGVTGVAAANQCDVMGGTYSVTLDGDEWTLTNFTDKIEVGPAPRCGGKVTLIGPDNTRSFYVWCVRDKLTVAGFPAKLTAEGLMIYMIPSNLHRLRVGSTIYMTNEKIPVLPFK